MEGFDNSYSRFVAWGKIVLPLAALALLSTMFLISRTPESTATLPFADIDVAELAQEQRIQAPNYAGMTRDGSAISVVARTAKPDPANRERVIASDLVARVETLAGAQYDLRSSKGEIDTSADIARLQGGVLIETSSGYTITTERLVTSLSLTDMHADGTVNADGPAGKLTAGQMTLSGGTLLVFKGGVNMVVSPLSD